MAVPKILYYNTNLIWMAGGKMDNWRALGVHAGYNAPNKGFDTIEPITYAPTCFMLIDHAVFDRIGIMDEKYFVYCDDTDFVYRAIQQGFKMIYTPHVVIDHKVSVSTGGDNSSFYIYYSNRNKIYFIRKHYRLLRKWIALAYMLLARFFFYLKFDKAQKQKLVQGIRDGWKMQIEKV
jgi:GT2 family glycosyltransferase